MNSITATIKREWLSLIISGKKLYEWREVNDTWMARPSKAGPHPFRLRLINGMTKDAPEATVEVCDVRIDEANGAFRFEVSRILEVLNWDSKRAMAFLDGWVRDDDESPEKIDRSHRLSITVSANILRTAKRGKECVVEIATDGEVWTRLKKRSQFPAAVDLTCLNESVSVVVLTMLTPVFSLQPTLLVVSGRADGIQRKAGA